MRTATAFDIFKELSGVIISVPFILPNVTPYSVAYQMLQIANLKIISTYSTETFSKLRFAGLNHLLPKLSISTVLYCVGYRLSIAY